MGGQAKAAGRFNARGRQSRRGENISNNNSGSSTTYSTETNVTMGSRPKKAKTEVKILELPKEVEEELQINPTDNPLILPSRKEADGMKQHAPKVLVPPEKKVLSKTQQKRLDKFMEKKLKKEERGKLLEKLSQSTFVMQNASLLRSSKDLGKKESLKERLRRQLLQQRAGITINDLEKADGYEDDNDMEEEDVVQNSNDNEDEMLGMSPDDWLRSVQVMPAASNTAIRKRKNSRSSKKRKRQHLEEEQGEEGEEIEENGQQQDREKLEKKEEGKAGEKLEQKNSFSQEKKVVSSSSKSASEPIVSSTACNTAGSISTNATENAGKTEPPTPTSQKSKNIVPVVVKDAPSTNTDARNLQGASSSSTAQKNKPAFYVTLQRTKEIQESRLQLPIIGEEQVIMEAIQENDFVIVVGETGSGKTTQLPQFLYEAGFGNPNHPDFPGMIGITQPRRIAAISMAARVTEELCIDKKSHVGYQIRYDTNVRPGTVIKFMTDGILLKEIMADFLLNKYSIIVIDEAHERNLNTDILIGLLSRIVPLRNKLARSEPNPNGQKPMKVVIMSATLRVSDFVDNRLLFPPVRPIPPVVSVEARQYPVTVHFNRRTPTDYMGEAFSKVCKINKRLPPGGILVFVTGQDEVLTLCRKLRKQFPLKYPKETSLNSKDEFLDAFDDFEVSTTTKDQTEVDMMVENNMSGDEKDYDEEDELEKAVADEDEDDVASPLYVLPLYSLLPADKQLLIFSTPPQGSRLCVVSTNVAETSITIPGIKYVVDCGKVKERKYEVTTGVQSYEINWISKASADQRAGRAGRTGPGHCYRLYSSAVFDSKFPQFTEPEILRMPIDNVVLQMKYMNIDHVINFPLPTPPTKTTIATGVKMLTHLGALEKGSEKITELGKRMALYPLSPRYSKIIAASPKEILPYVIIIVSALTVGDVFQQDAITAMLKDDDENNKEKLDAQRRQFKQVLKKFMDPKSGDLMGLLRVVIGYEKSNGSDSYCEENFVRFKAMQDIRKLRGQLTNIVNLVDSANVVFDQELPLPNLSQVDIIRSTVLSGLIDQVAIRSNEPRHPILGAAYRLMLNDELSYIHPSSCVRGTVPEWVVFHELVRTSHLYMKGVTPIDPNWLVDCGKSLCSFSQPLENPPPDYDPNLDEVICHAVPHYGPGAWELPPQKICFPANQQRARYFAQFLLEGKVFTDLKPFTNFLVSKPNTATKQLAQTKIIDLITPLATHDITTKKRLKQEWESNSKFLLAAYLQWIPREKHNDLREVWPPKQ